MSIVYVSIGNSDDKLGQAEWVEFVKRVEALLEAYGKFHGNWRSKPDDPWQNACWCVDIFYNEEVFAYLKSRLSSIAKDYRQDSIAWMSGVTEFIKPSKDD